MGEWTIVVQGHGIHDNKRPDDADQMTAEFVRNLTEAGHVIESARFTVGARREITPAETATETKNEA